MAVLTVATATAETVDVERDALMALYNSTDGANWADNTGWGTTNPHCAWHGVTCDAGKVELLFLLNNQLSGPIPPELGNLSSLRGLFLDRNQLSGSIPPELGNMSSLHELFLPRNQLSGPIPRELGNLSSLVSIDLSFNNLSNPIPRELGNLSLVFLTLIFNPNLYCWESEETLILLSRTLQKYAGPRAVCNYAYLPVFMTAGD